MDNVVSATKQNFQLTNESAGAVGEPMRECSTGFPAGQTVVPGSRDNLPHEGSRMASRAGGAIARIETPQRCIALSPATQRQRPRGTTNRAVRMCCRKQAEIAALLMRRAQTGEFMVFRNIVVLVPHTPAKVDAEPANRIGLEPRFQRYRA